MDSTPTRVVSLVPGATDIIAALGDADRLVGVSHECDHHALPADVSRVTTTAIDPSAPSAAIDTAVRQLAAAGRAVVGIDAALLRELAPDLVVTQVLCEVCAVSDGTAQRLAAVLDPPPRTVTLDGTTLDGVFADVLRVADALGLPERGRDLLWVMRERLATLRERYRRDPPVPTVVIEWLEPCFLAGHWTPEIVAAAGGRDIATRPGSHSVPRDWREVVTLDPAVVVIALCGFNEARAREELERLDRPEVHRWLDARQVVVIDGNAYTSRAGPGLLEAIDVIGGKLHG